jgi:hypothetical protein
METGTGFGKRVCNCVVRLTGICYIVRVKTLTLRIQESLDRWLSDEAKRLGRTKSEIARQAILRVRDGRKKASLHDRMKEVCGTIRAPRDLSTHPKHLEGFGR